MDCQYTKQTLLYYRDTSYFYCLFDFYFITITFLFLYKSVTGLFNFFKRKILGYRITVITQDFGPCNAGSIPAGPTN